MRLTRPARPVFSSRQRGAALAVSLMMLLVMTLIGVSAMRLSVMQEKMAGNTRDLDLALQAAEAALRFGETRLEAASLPPPGTTAGWYSVRTPGAEPPEASVLRSLSGWGASAPSFAHLTYGLDGGYWDVAAAPQLVIAELNPVPDPGGSLDASRPDEEANVYQVTARGFGGSQGTGVILQSTYRR